MFNIWQFFCQLFIIKIQKTIGPMFKFNETNSIQSFSDDDDIEFDDDFFMEKLTDEILLDEIVDIEYGETAAELVENNIPVQECEMGELKFLPIINYNSNQPPSATNRLINLQYDRKSLERTYKLNSCFKNAILKIKTNLIFDLNKFTTYFGGQITSKIPSNRLVINIKGAEHTLLTYHSGICILTNVYFLFKIDEIYDYFNSLFMFCMTTKIAQPKRIRIERNFILKSSFLIENFHFSLQIDNASKKAASCFDNLDRLKENMKKKLPNLEDIQKSKFPAIFFKFKTCRKNLDIVKFKSTASKKRHKEDNFKYLTTSIHMFKNFKFIITGCQTQEDLFILKDLLLNFIQFFYDL